MGLHWERLRILGGQTVGLYRYPTRLEPFGDRVTTDLLVAYDIASRFRRSIWCLNG